MNRITDDVKINVNMIFSKQCILLTTIAFVSIILISCSSQRKSNEQLAERYANELYAAIGAGQFNVAADMYSNRFYEFISKEKWIRVLQSVQAKLGPYQSRKLESYDVQQGFSDISGITIILVFQVEYMRQRATEKLTFVRPNRQKDEIELVGHKIDF